ncbi:MAG: uracil-DNA glycosylase [Phycisphaerae bacterium]|nr:uracil-DNA glycosylase [Phycisphaerae bacterium]
MTSARRLVAQHLQGLRLSGVDFIPKEPEPRPPPPAEAPRVTAEPPAHAPLVEPKPSADTRPQADDERSRRQALLDEVRRRYERDAPHERFVTGHTRIVFGEGDPCARVMFVGEAPGEEEDKTGRPFVGRAGQLLDKMIVAMGLSRDRVYIANVLKTRPPNNATPTPEEAALCAPYLHDQIRIVAPDALVTLGLPATRLILGSDESMSRLRGRWARIVTGEGRVVPVMPTYHPAYVLRQYTPEVRGKVWADLRLVVDRLAGLPASP